MASWTNQEKRLLHSLRPVCSDKEIQLILEGLGFERSRNAIQKAAKRAGLKFLDLGTLPNNLTPKEQEVADIVLKQIRDPIFSRFPIPPKTSSAKAKVTIASRELLNELHKQLWEIRENTLRTHNLKISPAGGRSLVIILSDSHFGELVEETEVYHRYDMAIASQRLLSIPTILEQYRSNCSLPHIDEILILMVGDHIDGEGIFHNQSMEIETHAADQVLKCTRAHWSLFQELKRTFNVPVRVVTIRGNHGRTGASKEANWDNIVYLQLELLIDMSEDKELSIQNRYGEVNPFVVQGWKGLIRHIAPAQADTAAGKAKYGGWEAIHEWDLMCSAHWHHWGVFTYMGKPIFRNGSMVGGNNFAESLATRDDPVQLAFTVTEESLPELILPLRW
jgi:hypothetical protein